MESKILGAARQLAKDILESDEYRSYQSARQKVREEGLNGEVQDLRSQIFFLQAQGPDAYRSQIGELTGRFEELMTHLSVKEYLDTEIKVCRMIQDVTKILTDDLEMDLDFLE